MELARGLEHEFLGHVILNYFDLPDLKEKGSTEIESLLGNIIRREIGISERRDSNIIEKYNKEKNIKEKIFETSFGFYEKCNENNENSYRWPGAPEPASKCPTIEGWARIELGDALKIAHVSYTVIIKYKYNENISEFI